MIQFSPDEARVLGVLIEKALTTPGQYPLTLNGLTNGCNQKSNRLPVVDFSEDRALDAVEKLRGKSFATRVDTYGSRVAKFRHLANEVLDVGTLELAILAELMLRGPQTLGEIRTRASRMRTLESLEDTRNVIEGLMGLDEPLVKRIAPAPGSRAERYTQLLTPLGEAEASEGVAVDGLGDHGAAAGELGQGSRSTSGTAQEGAITALTERIDALENDNRQLQERICQLEQRLELLI